MTSKVSDSSKSNIFATPPSKKLVSPKSLSRKPSFTNFTKQKSSELTEIRASDRLRFISPSKANLFVNEQSIDAKSSFNLNYTDYAGNQTINYPFIRRCVSPKHFNDITYSRKQSINSSFKDENSFFTNILSPSIDDFGNCDMTAEMQKIQNNSKYQQQISLLKKTNFDLNLLIDEKNEFIQKQKQQYDTKLAQLAQQLQEIKLGIKISQQKFTKNQQKIIQTEGKYKQLSVKFQDASLKLDKASKQVKMYRAKYRINFNSKDKQDLKGKKYHQNCCKGDQNHKKVGRNHENNCNKLNTLGQSGKMKIIQGSGCTLKKIKSQNILPMCHIDTSLDPLPEASRLMKLHSSDVEFMEYLELKVQIQSLINQIRYKDIQILTLKRSKCDYERQKHSYQKVKKFNKKLLARVQFLTKECDEFQIPNRFSLPSQKTPRKKFKAQYEDFQNEEEQETIQLFELSPEKNFPENKSRDKDYFIQEARMPSSIDKP